MEDVVDSRSSFALVGYICHEAAFDHLIIALQVLINNIKDHGPLVLTQIFLVQFDELQFPLIFLQLNVDLLI